MLVRADFVFDLIGVSRGTTVGEVFGRAGWCVVVLSLKTYVFEDNMTRYWPV